MLIVTEKLRKTRDPTQMRYSRILAGLLILGVKRSRKILEYTHHDDFAQKDILTR